MTIRTLEGDFRNCSGRYAIVVARFNAFVVESLLAGALDTFKRHGIKDEDITIIRVPGAWELPVAASALAASQRYSALVALGCVVRGDTRHYEQVADGCSDALMRVQLDYRLPVANGVLAVEAYADAEARAGGAMGNKGEEAALAALEMSDLLKHFQKAPA